MKTQCPTIEIFWHSYVKLIFHDLFIVSVMQFKHHSNVCK